MSKDEKSKRHRHREDGEKSDKTKERRRGSNNRRREDNDTNNDNRDDGRHHKRRSRSRSRDDNDNDGSSRGRRRKKKSDERHSSSTSRHDDRSRRRKKDDRNRRSDDDDDGSSRGQEGKEDRRRLPKSSSKPRRNEEEKSRTIQKDDDDRDRKRGHSSSGKKHKRDKEYDDERHHHHHRSSRHHKSHHKEEHDDDRKHKKKKKKKHDDHKSNQSLYPLGPITNKIPAIQLDPDTDYFPYCPHLRLYLYRRNNRSSSSRTTPQYFEDLTSDDTHDAFVEFCKKYNSGTMEEVYYAPVGQLPADAMEQCVRTKFKWGFDSKVSKQEKQSLDLVKEGVRRQTEYKQQGEDANICKLVPPLATSARDGGREEGKIVSNSKALSQSNTKEDIEQNRMVKNRRYNSKVKLAEEEMSRYGGKTDPGSHERKIFKKREQSNAQHGASIDRESYAAGMEMDDSEIYGGGANGSNHQDGGFQRALQREKERKRKRNDKNDMRIMELQQKEQNKQEEMLKVLGLTGLVGQNKKITIAPRKDGPPS